MFLSSRSVLVGGSRQLPAPGLLLARRLGAALARGGFPLLVGCAAGVDQAVLQGFLSLPGSAPHCSVFSAAPAPGSRPWVRTAAAAGARVVFSAGGPRSVPYRARLFRRSEASARAASLAAVFVVGSPESRGSFNTARFAASLGLPVFVVPVGFPASTLPPLGAGRWSASSLLGHACFAWRSDQPTLI